MINSDCYYEIGAGHTYCQDYADSGKFLVDGREYHYAVVCDGCSASKDSDFGARFLAKTFPLVAKLAISSGQEDISLRQDMENLFLHKMSQGMNVSLDPSAFDATVVAILFDVTADTLYSFIWGDGKIYGKFKNGEHGYLTDVTYVKNAPYYLSYKSDAKRDVLYESHFGTLYADILSYVVKPDGLVRVQENDKFHQKYFFEKMTKVSSVLSFASVFTDGIDTYHKKDDVNIILPRHNIFNQLTQYKNFHGKFVERRMQKVRQFCQKEGWQHFDDISVATIVLS